MRMALEIVVVTIILLVVALVIIVFFVKGLQPGVDMTDARNSCITTATASCRSLKTMPPTWSIPTISTKDGPPQSCQQATGYGNDCSNFGVTGGGAQSGGGSAATTSAQCAANKDTCMAVCAYPLSQQRGECSDNPTNKICCGS